MLYVIGYFLLGFILLVFVGKYGHWYIGHENVGEMLFVFILTYPVVIAFYMVLYFFKFLGDFYLYIVPEANSAPYMDEEDGDADWEEEL